MHIFDKAPFPSCHASTLVETAPGRFLGAWFGGKGEAKDVQIWASSFDGTRWGPPGVLASEPGQPCWNPVLFRTARGILTLWYKFGPSPMTWSGAYRTSADDGKSWSKPELLPAGFYGPVRAKPITLADGTLLAPTSVESYRVWTPFVDRSTDAGKTWTRSNAFHAAGQLYGQIQPTLFTAKDGRVIALMRTKQQKIYRSESADGGKTFTPAVPTELPNPSSGIDVVKAADGHAYLIYNPVAIGRSPLSLARSTDDGTTWKRVFDYETGLGEFSYPAIVLGADGQLHATYTWNRTHISYRVVDPAKLCRLARGGNVFYVPGMSASKPKPPATLSLDLDDKWSYLKTHGDAGWEKLPSYYPIVVPRVLEILAEMNVRITWFVVGRDADVPANRGLIESIAAAGHEVGNHSYHHEPWLHLYSPQQLDDEIGRSDAAVHGAAGVKPVGFRGPGFSLSPTLLDILHRRGYRYDASTFPTYVGPLARAYYFMTSKLTGEEKAKRAKLFGSMSAGLAPVTAYQWHLAGGRLPEIPVTTLPVLKTPIHLSYLLYLARFSMPAAKAYFRFVLWACRHTGTAPSFLLHPLDFLGGDDDADLGFFPAMDRPAAWKVAFSRSILAELAANYDLQPLGTYVESLLLRTLPDRHPAFAAV